MDDEDTLLPRKLQAALEQALERKNELINQDSDSDSDDGKIIWKQVLSLQVCASDIASVESGNKQLLFQRAHHSLQRDILQHQSTIQNTASARNRG